MLSLLMRSRCDRDNRGQTPQPLGRVQSDFTPQDLQLRQILQDIAGPDRDHPALDRGRGASVSCRHVQARESPRIVPVLLAKRSVSIPRRCSMLTNRLGNG